jgi:hypothetical protein
VGNRKSEQAGKSTAGAVLRNRGIVPAARGLARYVLGTKNYLFGAATAGRSSCRNGRTEKNLCRQGSQRSAGNLRIRPKAAAAPGTYSAEMRCNFRLPQFAQWA